MALSDYEGLKSSFAVVEPTLVGYSLEEETMKLKSNSYPERIRQIAHELSRLRNQYEVGQSVEKLLMVANDLERNLKQPSRSKP
jgi:hypothetical protein